MIVTLLIYLSLLMMIYLITLSNYNLIKYLLDKDLSKDGSKNLLWKNLF